MFVFSYSLSMYFYLYVTSNATICKCYLTVLLSMVSMMNVYIYNNMVDQLIYMKPLDMLFPCTNGRSIYHMKGKVNMLLLLLQFRDTNIFD